MKIFAHRGSSGTRPENTLPAFAEAVRLGADGIELDVQLTKDGELIVMHDEEVNRTTDGRGAILSKTLSEIKELNAGSWFDEKYASTKVPTLKEVLDLLVTRNYRGMLAIELKTDKEPYPGIEEKVSQLLTSQEWPFTYGYSSFNMSTLERIHLLEPETQIDFIMGKSEKKPPMALERSFIQGLHPDIRWVWKHQDEIREFPLAVRPWTVNKKAEIKCCIDCGVAGIFTDFPEKALEVKRNDR
ncbi:glycerophosphodiester phosphodiesterase [Enterococcus olivae]